MYHYIIFIISRCLHNIIIARFLSAQAYAPLTFHAISVSSKHSSSTIHTLHILVTNTRPSYSPSRRLFIPSDSYFPSPPSLFCASHIPLHIPLSLLKFALLPFAFPSLQPQFPTSVSSFCCQPTYPFLLQGRLRRSFLASSLV